MWRQTHSVKSEFLHRGFEAILIEIVLVHQCTVLTVKNRFTVFVYTAFDDRLYIRVDRNCSVPACLGFLSAYEIRNRMNGYSGGAYNVAVSVFNQENIQSYESEKNHIEFNLKRKDVPQRGSGSSVPSHLNETSFSNSISQTEQNSNTSTQKNQDRNDYSFDAIRQKARRIE